LNSAFAISIHDLIACISLASFDIMLPKQFNYFTLSSCWLQVLLIQYTSLQVNWSITWRHCEVEIAVTFVQRNSFLWNDVAWGLYEILVWWCGSCRQGACCHQETDDTALPSATS
jgi:hypothetical protein